MKRPRLPRRATPPPPPDQPPKKTQLTPIGDGHGVVIDKEILDRMKISPDTNLWVSTDGFCITIGVEGRKRPPEPPPPPEWEDVATPEPMIRLPKKQPW